MLTSVVIFSRHPVRSALPFPLSTSRPLYLLASSIQKSQVTKSPVVHPLSVHLLTKCSSRNSFLLTTIHFDGGGCTPQQGNHEHNNRYIKLLGRSRRSPAKTAPDARFFGQGR